MIIELDMYQTLAIAVVVLMLGKFLRKNSSLLEKFCIPAPVVGGVLFAVFTCVCYVTGIVEFTFDDILKEVCMVFFFTSVGFQANLKVLKSGGKSMLVFLSLVIALILAQNFLAVGLSNVMRISRWWAFAPEMPKSSSTGPKAPAVPWPPTIEMEPVQRPTSG